MPATPDLRARLIRDDRVAPASPSTSTLAPGQIPNHPWVTFGGETLALSINLAQKNYPTDTQVQDFHRIVQLYSVFTKTCLVSVTLPEYRFDVQKSNHGHVFFNLVTAINQFPRLGRCEVVFRMPDENFTQLTNACQFYRLNFKQWKLFSKIGTQQVQQVKVGSRTDRRLNGWFKVNIAGSP
ncbi:uncharacterized protein EAE98_001297 [Botrytis deweyae]|uniref:RRM domain-containing protein n=1 Tax=Botrytis deweyae TaxID=2478750 RepID=A0ABQ7J152_9HELO|nr:uncharacterized protein EAE98_001297 [Botrytis deweyae]KAF7938960.1 hypothetical protein EAE98_001297 [Botrytis deweyae]